MAKAIVLLSGGLDSAATLAVAQSEGFDVHAISFCYGQRHRVEVDAARKISKEAKISEHKVVEINLGVFGHSALTDEIEVPKDRSSDEMNASIPVTYVPARNTIFLSYALAFAEVREAQDIFIGVNALDYSGYPDCRPEYISAFQSMANLATARSVGSTSRITIRTPMIEKTKAQIIRIGYELGARIDLTVSCYQANEKAEACGRCDACILRRDGFSECGLPDPTRYYGCETVQS